MKKVNEVLMMMGSGKYSKWLRRLLLKLNGPTPERGNYKNPAESLSALIGYSIGLGNLWRFPKYCHLHGAGTFMIPYMLFMVFLGIPLCLLDQALGQYVSLGPTHLYTFMCPLLSGIGWGMELILLMVNIHYNILLGWVIIYIKGSLGSTPHWSHCYRNGSLIQNCVRNDMAQAQNAAEAFFWKEVQGGNWTHKFESADRTDQCKSANGTEQYKSVKCTDHYESPNCTEQYWSANCTDQYESDNCTDPDQSHNTLHWPLVASDGLAWLLIAAVLAVGIKRRARIMYFTVIYPYVILVFLIMIKKTMHSTSQEEEDRRLLHELTPNWTHLRELPVWTDAASQVFYSVGIGLGGITTISSYNTFNHNFIRDGFLVCLLDMGTSFLCGYCFYSLKETQTASSFLIVSSTFLSLLDTQPWSSLFFLMVFILGFNCQFMMVECLTTVLLDHFKPLRRWHLGVVVVICFVLFLLGLPMCIAGKMGSQWFDMMNKNVLLHSVFMLSLLQVITAGYIYGFDNIMRWVRKEMQQWVPWPLYWYLYITWHCITPLVLVVLLGLALCEYSGCWKGSPVRVLGHVIAVIPSLLVPLFALHAYHTRGDKSVRDLVKADPNNFCPESRRIIREPVRQKRYSLDRGLDSAEEAHQ